MNTINESKITNKQLKNLLLLKMMTEENLSLLNFLIAKDVIKINIEIRNFKERVDAIKDLIEKVLFDKSVESLSISDINEVKEMELNEEFEDIKKIKNKSISKKYRKIFRRRNKYKFGTTKENIKIFFNVLRNTNIDDIAILYNRKLYPISEIEQIYKYI